MQATDTWSKPGKSDRVGRSHSMTTQADDFAIDLPNRSRGLIPFLLLTLGFGSVLMLLANNWIYNTLISERLEVMRTVGEVRTQSAIVHIWIEELVSGDSIDRPGIADALRGNSELLDTLTDAEASSSWSDWFLNENREVLDYITRTRALLIRFDELTHSRQLGFDQGRDVSIGSEVDIIYDQMFESLLLELDSLHTAMERRLEKAIALQQTLSHSIVLAWIAIVAIALGGIWKHDRKRREAEQALRQSEAHLFQAQKAEAIGRLAGGIAHDINNHLAAISMQCEAIKLRIADPADTESRVNAIISTAGKSATMIKRLLAFSRKQPIQPKIINANDVVIDLKDFFSGLVSEDVRMEMRLATDLRNVSIDPSQLEQIILNLVVNACEAMPSGGSLVVETSNLTAEVGDVVCLRVTDTGTGIPTAILDRIFEPFFTTKDMALNSGLGLATIDGIARQNGGQVLVESEAGKGTTFRVLLPISERAADHQTAKAAASLSAPLPAGSTILLVEDNDELRLSTGVVLRAFGYTVHLAESAEKALQIYAELAPAIDIAIVDVIMPGMDGKQLVDELKLKRPELNVLFVSSYTDDRISERGITSQEVDFLSKPFTVSELASKVAAILARSQAGSSVA